MDEPNFVDVDKIFRKDFNNWTEEDFEAYRKWCIYVVRIKNGLMCRECVHLHCHWAKCTIKSRIDDLFNILMELDYFPPEICVKISNYLSVTDNIMHV